MARWNHRVVGVAEALEAYGDGKLDASELGGQIAQAIRAVPIPEAHPAHSKREELIDEIGSFDSVESPSYIDACLGALYDWADANRVWIEPSPVAA